MTNDHLMVLIGCFFVVGPLLAGADEPTAFSREELDFFEQRVRPILVESCQECHGVKKQEAGLRLDSRVAALRGSDEGPVVLLGKPAGSRLIEAVKRGSDLKMPPDSPLSPAQVEVLERWVEMRLPWPEPAVGTSNAASQHWAYQPPRPALIPPGNRDSAKCWIDVFVGARLESAGLAPSAPASRRAQVRRLNVDLLGLPPDQDHLADFESTELPDAYERLVDSLLASPAHGERWARHWLDVARYADNKGYVFFEEKNFPWAYAYRDYVIESLNRDLPYDRFVMEQLVADQLDLGDDRRPLRALGFLTLGAHFMNNIHDIADDRIDVMTRGLMAITVTCARCHDHKYDPISQADYYALYGVMRSCEEPLVAPLYSTPDDTDEYRKFVAELSVREGKLNEFVQRKHRELVDGGRARVPEYLLAVYAARNQPATDDFTIIADTTDVNPAMIKRWRSTVEKGERTGDPIWVAWHRLAAIDPVRLAEQSGAVIDELLGREPGAVHPHVRRWFDSHRTVVDMKDVAAMYGELLTAVDKRWRESLSAVAASGAASPTQLADPDDESLRRLLYGPTAPPDVPPVFGWGFLDLLPDRASQGEYQKLLKEVEQWLMTGPGAPARTTPLLDSSIAYEPRIFQRGNPLKLGEPVPRQFPAVLNPKRIPFTKGSGRLELAQLIADPANPLTARVFMNRLWMWHFGQALVRTPSDFGVRCQPPTHPELLDELALRFGQKHRWSVKSMHRQLLLSATYRQASVDRPEGLAADPENRWLWRMNPRRLEFESFRDALLAAAQQLDHRIGGPPVQLLGDAVVPRRTIYGFIDRMDVAPLLTTFDFPNPSVSNPARETTTVAPQSLYFMNNAFLMEIATQVLRRSDLPSEPRERVTRLFELLFSRRASTDECAAILEYLGPNPDEPRWRQLTQALLLANEFLYVD